MKALAPALCALSFQALFINGEPGRALHMTYRQCGIAMTALAEQAGRSVNHVSRLIAAEDLQLHGAFWIREMGDLTPILQKGTGMGQKRCNRKVKRILIRQGNIEMKLSRR